MTMTVHDETAHSSEEEEQLWIGQSRLLQSLDSQKSMKLGGGREFGS